MRVSFELPGSVGAESCRLRRTWRHAGLCERWRVQRVLAVLFVCWAWQLHSRAWQLCSCQAPDAHRGARLGRGRQAGGGRGIARVGARYCVQGPAALQLLLRLARTSFVEGSERCWHRYEQQCVWCLLGPCCRVCAPSLCVVRMCVWPGRGGTPVVVVMMHAGAHSLHAPGSNSWYQLSTNECMMTF